MVIKNKDTIKIIFFPSKKPISVPKGITIREAALLTGIVIDTPCAGEGTCGKCKVEILKNVCPPTSLDIQFISQKEIEKGIRLACQTKLFDDTTVSIPKKLKLDTKKILISGPKRTVNLAPGITKIYLELEPQTIKNQISDEELIRSTLGDTNTNILIGYDVLKEIPYKLRSKNYKITIILSDSEIIDIEPGNTTSIKYGLAIDIGTTSIVGILVDLTTGKTIGIVSELNTQLQFGADVISRINFVINNENGLEKLHNEIIEVINRIIAELTLSSGINPKNIYDMAVLGNTTMQHFFLGITPRNLTFSPYVGAVKKALKVKAKKLNINIHPQTNVYLFPNIAGFVGGDTVGLILALNMHKSENIKLAIDIGTNGEIVLGNKNKLLTTSCAAGPAFEGGQITNGMRAITGAIESVYISEDGIFWRVIGRIPAEGICGSGLLDLIAELNRFQIIDKLGKIRNKEELKDRIPQFLLNNIIENKENGNSFIITQTNEKSIILTQKDVREFQLAKAAIHTGIEILKKEANITNDDISEVYIAGTFGNYIDRTNAKAIGIIPDFNLKKVKFVGNAAAEGARLALISKNEKDELNKILNITKYIEISGRLDFQEEFANSLFFK